MISISFIQTVKVRDYLDLIEIFMEFWDVKGSEYNYDFPKINFIVFTYKILPDDFKIDTSKFNKYHNEFKEKTVNKIKGFNLPATMDFTIWENNYEINDEFNKAIVYKKNNSKYLINIFDNYTNVSFQIKDKIIYEFSDTRNDIYNLDTFSRKFKTHIYNYIDGKLVIKQIERKCDYLKSINLDVERDTKFLTMDLETINIDNVLSPVCVSIYDGTELFNAKGY